MGLKGIMRVTVAWECHWGVGGLEDCAERDVCLACYSKWSESKSNSGTSPSGTVSGDKFYCVYFKCE